MPASIASRIARAALVACGSLLSLAAGSSAWSAPLLDEAFLLGDRYQPRATTFDLATAGNYTLRLNDLGFPEPLGSAQALLTRGSSAVAALTTVGSAPVALQSGRHKVLVAATPAREGAFGTFGVALQPAAGGSNVLDYSDQARSLQPATPALQVSRQVSFTVTAPGTYRLAATDLAFPAPLQRLDVLVTTSGGAIVATLSQGAPSADVNLAAGNYTMLTFAEATGSAGAGAYSLAASGAGGQPIADVFGVGALGTSSGLTLGAGGSHTLQLTDLAVPGALAGARALVTRGDAVLARADAPGTTNFAAAAGAAKVFVLLSPGAGLNRGAGAVLINSGATRVLDEVDVTTPATSSGAAVLAVEPIDLATAGSYRAELTDFQFPAPAASAAIYVVQGGAMLGQLNAPGTVDVNAAAGRLFLLVDAAPNGVTRSSLLGTRLLSTPANSTVADTTLALGILLQSRTVDIPVTGPYDLAVADLRFPAALGDLALAVTRDGQRVASIFGSGSVRFNATAGRYALNLLARTSDANGYGAYALQLDATPPPPVVTLTANPVRIRAGQTTQLTWSATGATGCVAADAWSGSRPTSGTFTTAALNAGARYTLTCTGAGGSTSASVDIEVRPVSTSGGGGASGTALLGLLALCGLVGRRRRHQA